MIEFFKTILYEPLYNILVALTGLMPVGDVGLAIIALTVAVRVILFPFQHKQSKSQQALKKIQPELEAIKKKHAGDRQKLALEQMALFKRHGVNPFSGIANLFIQLPILFALYFVFSRGLPFDPALLYPFVSLPETVNLNFLGLIDLTSRSIPLAVLAGITQFIQVRLSVPPLPPKKEGAASSLADDFARSMNLNLRYFMPAIILFVSLTLPSAIVLYWVTSTVFMIGHELIVRRKAAQLAAPPKLNQPEA